MLFASFITRYGTYKTSDSSINVQITDEGIGILPHERQRLTEPFFRGSNIGEISGLGLGLTIARSAVEAHGGTITFEDLEGHMTTVTIWIPN